MTGKLAYVPAEELKRLRELDSGEQRIEAFATACRLNTLYMVARAGSGHLGTSFSCMDIVTQLHLDEMQSSSENGQDVYFSSKGHDAPGLYAVLLGLGLLDFELIHHLRRLGGLPGHPDVSTPHIATNTGSLGMGISKAKGMALARRCLGLGGTIYVLLGDGELQEGQFWESLGSAVELGLGEIVAIVDHNKIQSDTWVDEVASLGALEQKLEAFGWAVDRCDGHSNAAVSAALARLRADPRPGILIADTVKGKGVSFMEGTQLPRGQGALYGFHSGAPSPDDYQRAVAELRERARALLGRELEVVLVEPEPRLAPKRPQQLVAAYSRALVGLAERDSRLFALDADLVLDTGLIPFRSAFPERFVECGIAEQDMVSTAGGLALAGMLPFVHSFACFLSTRPNEQIYNNATENTKIVYVGSLAGLLPGGPGHSHQSVRDISLFGSVPGMTLVEPCTEAEVEALLTWIVDEAEGPVYLRLVSVPIELPFDLPLGQPVVAGCGTVLRPGWDAVFVAAGPVLLAEAWRAAELLEASDIEAGVVELPFLNRVDGAWLRSVVGEAPVFALDNHHVRGGHGSAVQGALGGRRGAPPVNRIGVTGIPVCGRNAEVLRAHALDAESLALSVTEALAT